MPNSNHTALIAIIITIFAAGGFWVFFAGRGGGAALPAPGTSGENGLIEVGLGQTVMSSGVAITPLQVLEDSRCPIDVTCIQAGRVRLRASLTSGLGRADQVFLIDEPVTTEAEIVTLVEVKPAAISTRPITGADYRFIFKIQKVGMTYDRASADLIRVDLPFPGAVTGKEFKVVGEARGTWFFEASFPIEVVDKNGATLVTGIAQAQSDWMTTDFVPFSADIVVPSTYIGPATIVLHKDNPSGDPATDASASFLITIEY